MYFKLNWTRLATRSWTVIRHRFLVLISLHGNSDPLRFMAKTIEPNGTSATAMSLGFPIAIFPVVTSEMRWSKVKNAADCASTRVDATPSVIITAAVGWKRFRQRKDDRLPRAAFVVSFPGNFDSERRRWGRFYLTFSPVNFASASKTVYSTHISCNVNTTTTAFLSFKINGQ